MADETIAIARIRLARDITRLMALPVLLMVLAAAAGGIAALAGDTAGLVLGALAVLVALVAVGLAVMPLSLQLEVEVGGLRVHWLTGQRRYQLVRGPVTRVTVTGTGRGVLRSRHPILGWSNSLATLRDEEPVTLLRLATTPTVILIPTDQGRLAIAAESELDLLEALGAAARVQQRLDEVSGRVTAAFAAGIPDLDERRRTAARASLPAPTATAEAAEPEPARFLTGIERAHLEERLAAAREAALLAAEAERQAALDAAAAGGMAAAAPAPPEPARREPGVDEVGRWTAPSLARQRIRATWTRPAWATDARLRVLVTMAWAGVPLVVSIVTWLITSSSEFITSQRQLSLALTLGGPGAALGVVLARAWWPRLTGLVTGGAVAGLLLVARAAFG
jgi:hypothetical protein